MHFLNEEKLKVKVFKNNLHYLYLLILSPSYS